ncbi:hypothetical protein AAG570_013681 [Ranatra chinensis]|uniref:Uncharacterized protein n=1 Tax=Ranatra chinensis TaxID=642074 RepID=A0ABD0YCW3_9HEMI
MASKRRNMFYQNKKHETTETALAAAGDAGLHGLYLHGGAGGLHGGAGGLHGGAVGLHGAAHQTVVSVPVVDTVRLATAQAAHARAAVTANSEAAASVAAAHRAASAVTAEAEARAESEARGAEAAVAATRARIAQVAHQEYAALADSHAKVAASARAESDARAASAAHAERIAAVERSSGVDRDVSNGVSNVSLLMSEARRQRSAEGTPPECAHGYPTANVHANAGCRHSQKMETVGSPIQHNAVYSGRLSTPQ